jgi:hypothetical protein
MSDLFIVKCQYVSPPMPCFTFPCEYQPPLFQGTPCPSTFAPGGGSYFTNFPLGKYLSYDTLFHSASIGILDYLQSFLGYLYPIIPDLIVFFLFWLFVVSFVLVIK